MINSKEIEIELRGIYIYSNLATFTRNVIEANLLRLAFLCLGISLAWSFSMGHKLGIHFA